MDMNKVTGDILRNVLKVGGAVLATSGFLPAQCTITDPALGAIAGTVSLIIGSLWGIYDAKRHDTLKKETGNV